MAGLADFQTEISDLLRQQARAVDQKLRDVLATRGVDPDDRSPGWEDRARDALEGLELTESVEWLDNYRARIVTVIRPKGAAYN